ncbi:MAG: hypothetical protein AAF721_01945 [Myxococcota bacterium]
MAERRAARSRFRLTPGARTFLWMGAFSVVTLALGVLREFVIARDLQASGAADLFFRGLVVVGACRNFGTALFRARWVPVGPGIAATELLRREWKTCVAVGVIAISALYAFAGSDWREPTILVFAVAVVLAILGAAVRALGERGGFERRAFVLEWALPIGTIIGAISIGRGALGPAVGITGGLAVGLLILAPAVLLGPASTASQSKGVDAGDRTKWLLVDTLAYVNLGLLDAALSQHIFDEGGYALLNYGWLFVNAALAVPTAAATVVALRLSSEGGAEAHRKLRAWALVAGGIVGVAVAAVWWLMGWELVASRVDAAAGWAMTEKIRPVILYAVPFAALRLANTVGRQFQVVADPKRLLPWDFAGLAGRAAVLVIGVRYVGIVASPLGVAFAELVQIGAWFRAPKGSS